MDITVPQSPADPAFDNYPGDIRNAKVMFVDRDNSDAPISGWLTVNLVDPSDLKIGNAIFTGPGYLIGGLSSSTPSKQVTVGVIVDYGYYIRNSDDDDVVLTVYLPVGDFITGGGYIIPNESVGTKASDDGKKANFGFNVKFGNGGKNLQGSMNIIFRRTESDGIHPFHIVPARPVAHKIHLRHQAHAPAARQRDGKRENDAAFRTERSSKGVSDDHDVRPTQGFSRRRRRLPNRRPLPRRQSPRPPLDRRVHRPVQARPRREEADIQGLVGPLSRTGRLHRQRHARHHRRAAV